MAGFRARGGEPIDLRAVPYPAVTLAFDLAGGLVVAGEEDRGEVAGSVVAGMPANGSRGVGNVVECLQVRISPVVAHAVLGDCPDLTSAVVPLDAVWGRDAERLVDRLHADDDWGSRFAAVQDALASRLERRTPADPEVTFAWRKLLATRGQARVDQLAADVEWSRKRLWSRFRRQVGMSPKRAARLIRFDHAAHRLAAGHRPATVAAETGYTDESHLHRDARAFAGMTPTGVAAAPWLSVDDVAWSARVP